jgi:putative tryptophan/tyrosine transport system substrate-binding protein
MRRREFIAGLGGAAAVWPIAARAQQGQRTRRIVVVQTLLADDPLSRAQLGAFAEALGKFGWIEGRNIEIDYRFGAENPDRARRYAAELVALPPDAVLAVGAVVTKTLQQASREIPIVFVVASDPVGEGLVATQARPGGNTTGFAASEYGTTAKSLELLKEIAPNVTRLAVIRDPTLTANAGQFGAMQAVAPQLGVELSTIDVRDSDEIARGIAAFARGPNGGLVVANSAAALIHRELIITLAARHRLPATYTIGIFVTDGGLISYGVDVIEPFRRGADYINRILKGEKPSDLPVQTTTQYQTILNMKTAKSLGLTVPQSILLRADEVIE